MAINVIIADLAGKRTAELPTVNYQYDIHQYLQITGIELPDYFAVDFCNLGDTSTITVVYGANGAQIPDSLFLTGKPIKAFIVLNGPNDSTQTRYEITLSPADRPARSGVTPTPAEKDTIDSLIEELNNGVGRAEAAAQSAEQDAGAADQSASDAEAWAVGQRGGQDVEQGDETFRNNSKFYAGVAGQHAEGAGFAFFHVDNATGKAYVTVSDNLVDNVSFSINNSTGKMEVTVA